VKEEDPLCRGCCSTHLFLEYYGILSWKLLAIHLQKPYDYALIRSTRCALLLRLGWAKSLNGCLTACGMERLVRKTLRLITLGFIRKSVSIITSLEFLMSCDIFAVAMEKGHHEGGLCLPSQSIPSVWSSQYLHFTLGPDMLKVYTGTEWA
jgi:hypothetical protein